MSRAAGRRAPSPLRAPTSSYPHQSAAGQIAALGKGFTGFGVGKEVGKWLGVIREAHGALVPAGNHSRHHLGSWVSLLLLLLLFVFSLLVPEAHGRCCLER